MRNYVNFLKYFDVTLAVLSVAIASVKIASFISAIGKPVGPITSCIAINFTLSNGCVKPILIKFKSKEKLP